MVKKVVVDMQILQILNENSKSIERLGWKNFDCEEFSSALLKMMKSLVQVAPSITKGLLRKNIGAAKLATSGAEAELLVSKIKDTITYVKRKIRDMATGPWPQKDSTTGEPSEF